MSRFDPNPPHDEAACFALHRENFAVHTVARFTVMGEPVSKARARFTKQGHAYTPANTRTAEDRMAWAFRAAAQGHKIDPEATYGVMGIFFHGTRQRRDVDNMLKLICDALNGIAWADDSQVTEVSGRRGFDAKENARTEVWIYSVGKVDRPTRNCLRCDTPFPTYDSWEKSPNGKKFCSPECGRAYRVERRKRTCQHCSVEFLASGETRETKFCSRECKSAARRTTLACTHCEREFTKQTCHVRKINLCSEECQQAWAKKRRTKRYYGTCEVCGAGTTRKEYTRCNACRLSGKKPGGKPT